MNDQHRQALLRSSAAYATARLSFENAIVLARRDRRGDRAHATSYTVPMIRAMLRSRPTGLRLVAVVVGGFIGYRRGLL